MTQMSKRSKTERVPLMKKLPPILAGAAILVVALLIYTANQSRAQKKAAVEVGFKDSGTTIQTGSNEIVSGTVNDIPYYHCAGSDKHLVLLHGAKFSKEDWKTSGILASFCRATSLSVSAMDLPVSAGHAELKTLLTAMQEKELLTTPVTALVTPSASGKTISDWMTNGNVDDLQSFVSLWIPVASYSAMGPSEEQVRQLTDNLDILAIYGSRDTKGKEVTERLAKLAGAETLEIEGGHPCYLDSPDAFVSAVLKKMNISI